MIKDLVAFTAIAVCVIAVNAFVSTFSSSTDKSVIAGNREKQTDIVESTITILVLEFVLYECLCSGLMADGVPFGKVLNNETTLNDFFASDRTGFFMECCRLISLSFIVTLIGSAFPTLEKKNKTLGTILRSVIIVFIALFLNSLLFARIQNSVVGTTLVSILIVFVSCVGLTTVIPLDLLTKNLQMDSTLAKFFCKYFPESTVGQSLKKATINSIILVIILMIIEKQFGGLQTVTAGIYMILYAVIYLLIYVIGMRLMVKAL